MKFQINLSHSDHRANEASEMVATGTLEDWHQKLVHQHYARVKHILATQDIKIKNSSGNFCKDCAIGKAHRLPFPKSETSTTRIGQLIHMDLCGPMQVNLLSGSRYFFLLKDDYSHLRTVYFLSKKSQVIEYLTIYVKKTEKHCPQGITTMRSDHGLEFINKQVADLLNSFGIKH